MQITRNINAKLLKFGLAACISAALAPMSSGVALAHADTAEQQDSSAYAPRAAYANSLFSNKAGTVQHTEATVGGTVLLSGDFQGGWGAVTFAWSVAEGDMPAGPQDGSASTLGTAPSGIFGDSDEATDGALSAQEADTGAYAWRQLDSITLPGQLPNLNKAVVPGGTSQTLELSDLQEGSYALCLTATDDAGDESSIYWDVSVQEGEGETMSSDTSFHLLVNPTQADINPGGAGGNSGSGAGGATANADAVGAGASDQAQRHASWRMPSKQDDTSAEGADASRFPKMGDALGMAPAVLSVVLGMAAVALAAMTAARAMRRRKADR